MQRAEAENQPGRPLHHARYIERSVPAALYAAGQDIAAEPAWLALEWGRSAFRAVHWGETELARWCGRNAASLARQSRL